MGKRPWNEKERKLKVGEIRNREWFLLYSTSRTFITNDGFIVVFWCVIIECIVAYYVDKNYSEIEIGSYNMYDKKIFEKLEKFRFEKEGDLDNEKTI